MIALDKNKKQKTLIIPDVHNRIAAVKLILNKEKDCNKVIFLGDWFDSFGDNEELTKATAEFLKEIINIPNYIFLLGNHDINYFFPSRYTGCSGFSEAKLRIIKSILSQRDIDKFVFHYWEQGWLLTHAGLSNFFINKFFVKKENIINFLYAYEEHAQISMRRQESHWFYRAGKGRGGSEECGGLTWCDFRREFVGTDWLKQICGHTEHNSVGIKDKNNFCLDTGLKDYGILRNKKFFLRNS